MTNPALSAEGITSVERVKDETFPKGNLVEIESNGVLLRGNLISIDSEKPLVLISQGAGKDQNPVDYFDKLQERLAAEGYGSLVLHTQGIGEGNYKSGGDYYEATLNVRKQNLRDGIEFLAKTANDRGVVLLTGSMNGHPAMELAAQLQEKLAAVVLLEPAVYRAEAEDATLGDGSPFQRLARGMDLGLIGNETKEQSRANEALNNAKMASPAFEALTQYTGPVFLGYGELDDVIDPIIKERLRRIVEEKGGVNCIVPGYGHKLLTNRVDPVYVEVLDFLNRRFGSDKKSSA